jgi:hypothetical protein
MASLFALAAAVFKSFFKGQRSLVLENLALRQQLAVYKRAQERSPLRSIDRAFRVWLSKSGAVGGRSFYSSDLKPELIAKPTSVGKLISLPVPGGIQHDYRLAA